MSFATHIVRSRSLGPCRHAGLSLGSLVARQPGIYAPILASGANRAFSQSAWVLEKEKQNGSTGTTTTTTTTTTTSTSSSSLSQPNAEKPPAEEPQGRVQKVWNSVKNGVVHTYHGFRLLATEVRISSGLLFRLLRGKPLSRRQQRQLRRTTVDLLRLLPFSFFVIVPFMEIFLPVALKLFPNMLPSTFSSKFAEEEKRAKLLKVRIEVAKFLQDAVKDQAKHIDSSVTHSSLFQEFLQKVRNGQLPSRDETIQVAKLFQEDLTLTNLTRPQLVSLCRFLNINAFGTDNFLRFTIRKRLDELKRDDQIIAKEGVDSLNSQELVQACISRGIYTQGASEDSLRAELSRWLDLRLNQGISSVLLVLSKAFSYDTSASDGSRVSGGTLYNSLAKTLANLPESALHEVQVDLDSAKTNKERLEIVQEQEELIKEEEQQESKEEERSRLEREKQEQEKRTRLSPLTLESSYIPGTTSHVNPVVSTDSADAEKSGPARPVSSSKSKDVRLTSEQASELGGVLTMLAAKSYVERELHELQDIKNSLKATRREANEASNEEPKPKSALERRISKMVNDLEQRVLDFDKDVSKSLSLLKVDDKGRIHIDDLHRAFELIAHRPSDEDIDALCEKLDLDKDGYVPVNDLISLAESEGIGKVFDSASISDFKNTMNEARNLTEEAKASPKLKREDVVAE